MAQPIPRAIFIVVAIFIPAVLCTSSGTNPTDDYEFNPTFVSALSDTLPAFTTDVTPTAPTPNDSRNTNLTTTTIPTPPTTPTTTTTTILPGTQTKATATATLPVSNPSDSQASMSSMNDLSVIISCSIGGLIIVIVTIFVYCTFREKVDAKLARLCLAAPPNPYAKNEKSASLYENNAFVSDSIA